jgi:hypothetical protein
VAQKVEVNFYTEKCLGLSLDYRPFGSDGPKSCDLLFRGNFSNIMIECIRTYRLQHKLDEPFGFSQWHYDVRNALLVEVVDCSEASGWGEPYWPSEVTQCGINSFYAPLLMGWNPLKNEAAVYMDQGFKAWSLIDSAQADGPKLAHGGNAVDGKGFFMEPTIMRDVTSGMALAKDEIALANDTIYGLAAYVFTSNLKNGLRAARDIQAGSVCINEPHYSVQLPHGGLKQSGVGKDCSRYSLEEYLTLKRVTIAVD